jgi:hypothetical protein
VTTLYPCKKFSVIVRNKIHNTSAEMHTIPSNKGMVITTSERARMLRATCHDSKCMCCKDPNAGDIFKLYNEAPQGELLFIH